MKYLLVTWPESQKLMEQKWFAECIFVCDPVHLLEIGPNAFFVPEDRYRSLFGEPAEQN